MVLVLYKISLFLALMFVSSCQDEITEKSLNQILDQLIEETGLGTYSHENENSSRIIYLKQDNVTRRTYDSRLDTVHSYEYEDLKDLVNQIENSKHNMNTNVNKVSSEAGQDITIQIERTAGHYQDNDGDKIQYNDIMTNEITKSDRKYEERPSKNIVLASDPESNLIHKYPELIIDRISYDVAETVNEPTETATHHPTIKHLTDEEKKEVAAKTLDSLLKIIMKGKNLGQKISQAGRKFDASNDKEHDDNVQRSTHIHNAYHNHVINNVPLPYNELIPRSKMSLGIIPESYRDLHHIINRPRRAYHDPNLQLSRWDANAGQNPLMSILRAQNRNRVHFIPNSLNILPRMMYGPLFRHKYPGRFMK